MASVTFACRLWSCDPNFNLQIDIWPVTHMGQNALTIFETPDITSWLFYRRSIYWPIMNMTLLCMCTGTCVLSTCDVFFCVCPIEFVTFGNLTMM